MKGGGRDKEKEEMQRRKGERGMMMMRLNRVERKGKKRSGESRIDG